MSISLPSRDVIKEIYKKQSLKFGGQYLEGDDVKINASLAWSRLMVTTKSGVDIFDVAVSLMMGVINEKPFQYGNRRLGFSLGVLTLRKNGWMLDISNSEALNFISKLSAENLPEEKIVAYFRQKSEVVGQ